MLEVLAVIAIVAYVIGRQLLGESLRGKRVILLPAVLTVIGLTRLGGGGHHVEAADVACLAVSAVIALAIGLGQGAMMRLEERDGGLWGRMPARSLLLWAALIASRVGMTVLAGALGAHVAASTAPIVLLLGVNRLGQAAAITHRALRSGIPFAKEKDGSVFLADRLRGLASPGAANGTGDRTATGYPTGYPTGPATGYPPRDDRDARSPYDSRYDDRYDNAYGNPYDNRSGGRDAYGPPRGQDAYDAQDPYAAPTAPRRTAPPASTLGTLDALGASLRDLRSARRQGRRSRRDER